MTTLCEAFNRINSRFGANRVKLIGPSESFLQFEILNYGVFSILGYHDVWSIEELMSDGYHVNSRCAWLESVAEGARGDDGKPTIQQCMDYFHDELRSERPGYTEVHGIVKFICNEAENGPSMYEQEMKSWKGTQPSYEWWLYAKETTDIDIPEPAITFERWREIREEFGVKLCQS